MGRKRNILVVGSGVMGSYHARVVAQSQQAKLAGIVDTNKELGKQLADKFDVPLLSSVENITNIDGIIVAASTEVHYDIALQVLDQKIALLLEKPVTTDIQSTRKLIQISQQSKTPMMCGLLERYNPAILTAQQLIHNPIHLSATRHSPYTPRVKTGVTWDLLIHDIDLINRFVDKAEITHSVGQFGHFHKNSANNTEDIAECIFQYSNGTQAHASASRIGQKKIRSLAITEPDKLIEIDLLRKDVTIYNNVSEQIIEENGRGYRQQTIIEIPEIVTSQEPLVAQLNRFIDLIEGKADQDEERNTILPAHEIIARIQED